MAVTQYLDTTAPGGGNGSEGSPWNSIQTAWPLLPSDDVTLICTGGDDTVTTLLLLNQTPATSLTIVGNWSGYNLFEPCYRIKSARFEVFGSYAEGKSLTFKRLLIENGLSVVPPAGASMVNTSPYDFRMEECGFLYSSAGGSTVYTYGVRDTGTRSFYMRNCVLMAHQFDELPINGNTALVNLGANVSQAIISGCVFHDRGLGIPTLASGSNTQNTYPEFTNCVSVKGFGYCTVKNSVYNSTFNATLVDSRQVSSELQDTFWVDPLNGDFTPVTIPPNDLLDKGAREYINHDRGARARG